MNSKATNYDGNQHFEKIDEFKAPNLKFNEKRDYTELANKKFETATGEVAVIYKALQSVQFSIDETGGEVKSEAGMDVVKSAAVSRPIEQTPRYFYVDDTFTLFLRESGKEMPYFACKVEDISKFQ